MIKTIHYKLAIVSHQFFKNTMPCPGCEIRTWKQFAIFLGVKRVSHSTEGPVVDAALRTFCKVEPSQRLDILTLEKGQVIMKTNEDLKLLLFYLIFGGGGGWIPVSFVCLVNDFTMLNCRGWNYMWWWFFFQFLKCPHFKKKWYCGTLEI